MQCRNKRLWKLLILAVAVITLVASLSVHAAAASVKPSVRFAVSNNPKTGTVDVKVQLNGDITGMVSTMFRFDHTKLTIEGIDSATDNLQPMDPVPEGILSNGWGTVTLGADEIPLLYCAANETYGYLNLIMAPTDSFSAANYTTVATITLKVVNNAVITSSDITLPTELDMLGTAIPNTATTENGVVEITADIVYNLIAAIPQNYAGKWGVCGADWALSPNGVLTVSGTGALGNGSSSMFELEALTPYLNQIHQIIINEGITSIEAQAFAGGTAVNTVVLPDSLEAIGEDVFTGCPIIAFNETDSMKDNAITHLQSNLSQHAPKVDLRYYTLVDEPEITEDYWETFSQDMFKNSCSLLAGGDGEYADYTLIKNEVEMFGNLLFVDVSFVMALPENGVIYTDSAECLTYTLTLDTGVDGLPTGNGTLTVTGDGKCMNTKNVSLSTLPGIKKYYKLIDTVDLSGSKIAEIGAKAFNEFSALETLKLPDGYYENTVSKIMTALLNGEMTIKLNYYEQTPTAGIEYLLMEGPMSFMSDRVKVWDSSESVGRFATAITFSIAYLYDVNSDGDVNSEDLTALLAVLFTQTADDTDSADFNDDGYIDAFDLALLIHKLNSFEAAS